MSLSVQIGLLLSVATALTSIVGFLYKHRGAVKAPDVDFRRPVRSSLVLFGSGWYVLGIGISTASWGLHVAALALAPISLVQSVIAGGLVLLTVVADRLFGIKVSKREWIGVACAALGLAFLAATLEGAATDAHSDYEVATIAIYMGMAIGAGLIVTAIAQGPPPRRRPLRRRRGPALGRVRHRDQGRERRPRPGDRGPARPARRGDRHRLPDRPAGLGQEPPGRRPGAGDRRHRGRGQHGHDRLRARSSSATRCPSDPLGLTLRILAFVLVISAAALTPAPVARGGRRRGAERAAGGRAGAGTRRAAADRLP